MSRIVDLAVHLHAIDMHIYILLCPGGGYSPHLMVGGCGLKKKYRGVRELLLFPKKGGLENWNKHRPKAVVREGVSSSCKGGLGGLSHKFCVI